MNIKYEFSYGRCALGHTCVEGEALVIYQQSPGPVQSENETRVPI